MESPASESRGGEEYNKRLHWAWVVLWTCFVNLFINFSIRLGYGIVLPEMIETLGFSRTAGASIYNAYLLSYLALTPFTGYLTDRLGARRVITAASLILGTGVLLMGTITQLWTACLFYAIVGLGATGMWTPILTVVQRWFHIRKRGLALGIMSTGYGLGFATMGAAFPWISHHYTWRHAWYFLGSGALIMVLVNGFFLRSDPESAGCRPWGEKGEPPGASKRAVKSRIAAGLLSNVFRDIRFWLIGASYFSIVYGLYGFTTFMVDYAKFQMGLPMEKASLLATVHGFSQVIGVLTVLPLSDYLGRKKTIILSNAFIASALFGILFSDRSPVMLYLLVAVFAFFYGAAFPVYGACAGDYFPREVMGTVIGAWTPFYGMGAILSHWATGLLRDRTGIYDYAFILNAALAVVATLLMGFVRKSSPQEGA